MKSLSDRMRLLADEMREHEAALAERDAMIAKLDREANEQLDVVHELRDRQRYEGLSEQARRALELIGEYLDEGDAIGSSQRIEHALLQAVACVREAKEAA